MLLRGVYDTLGVNMPEKAKDGFSQREIAIALNNCVTMASRPIKYGSFKQPELRKMREFAEALLEPVQELMDLKDPEGVAALSPEKAVYVLLAAALYVQTAKVQNKTGVLPAEANVREVLNVVD